MKAFIAIVRTEAGTVTKYQDFDTLAEAEAHVAEHGGWVAPCPGDNTKYWDLDVAAKTIGYDTAAEVADKKALSDLEYRHKRRRDYPPIGDQLDAIWKELQPSPESEAATIKAKITAVKAAHPK